jgi:7,8-dihydro-6-hydroxymethylpterin dimethyltransferase
MTEPGAAVAGTGTVPAGTATVLAETESVCPECLARIPASRVAIGDDVVLRKACPEHGRFETIVWRGLPAATSWVRPKTAAGPGPTTVPVDRGCPFDCGLCTDHRQASCCVLLEVTRRCDLACDFCFASAGAAASAGSDPDPADLAGRMIRLFTRAGPVNLQLSGGEPCVRDDLPEIAAAARDIGFTFVQVNTNGLRLARDPGFAQALREAGVATVFLQFDGTRDDIHRRMRGRPLAAAKLAAIEACGRAGLGVVLVPVVVPGINADHVGDILRFAIAHQPVVRGVHFQPVSYFGRFPRVPTDADRITLPEIIAGLQAQTDGLVRVEDFQPAGAENALCSFNGMFVTLPDGRLHPLTRASSAACCSGVAEPGPVGVGRARDSVARRWAAPRTSGGPVEPGGGRAPGPGAAAAPATGLGTGDWDAFLARARTHTLAVSGMAFQDAWTLDLDRLRDCHIHVAYGDGAIPFCAYNLTAIDGTGRTARRS